MFDPPLTLILRGCNIEEDETSKEYDIELTEGSTLTGTLSLFNGQPLSGIKIGVSQDSRFWEHPFSRFTLTGPEGKWSLESLGEGSYTLYAASSGIGRVWGNVEVPNPNNSLDLIINGALLRTQITNAQHLPLPSVTFHYFYERDGKSYQQQEHLMNEGGSYQIVVEGNLNKVMISSLGYRQSTFEGSALNTGLLYATLEKEKKE